MLMALGAAAAAGHASAVGLACASQAGHQNGGGAASQPASSQPHPAVDRHDAVRAKIAKCIAVGEACLAHCLDGLGRGDTSLAGCSIAVQDMLTICRATGSLIAGRSQFVAQAAALCVASCDACAKACEPHVSHHSECAACRQECLVVMAAVRPLVG